MTGYKIWHLTIKCTLLSSQEPDTPRTDQPALRGATFLTYPIRFTDATRALAEHQTRVTAVTRTRSEFTIREEGGGERIKSTGPLPRPASPR